MFCILNFLLLPLVVLAQSSCDTDGIPNHLHCSIKNLTRDAQNYLEWPEWCQVFHGNLHLRMINLKTANFEKLREIRGTLSLINSPFNRMPQMPNLVSIKTHNSFPGLVILNNTRLRDMRGFVDWNKDVKITGNEFPVFISGNLELDTVNLPKMFHKPYSPLLCEKRLMPNYNIQFAEGMSLAAVLFTLIICATMFLHPLSMGSTNVYFVPGYHKY
ncbi:Receptor L-domain domain-containing protein [Caenorhabditis elegans]|uniref:Receptor L-domain domain-containing protein n=1 Tax=Caenorhabditis elegans TaxID=6239 RepID=Q7YWP0_CAEEL|nr:Receptor L-domain domain-containing protein [Caenorhabditis elegans]CAE18018.1 Receptor L-domain domain-containing protein [Caenorhabditis elegans]|eukprot:NP_001023519.1 Insulin/EGF-Receptor L Domain protein [Caenorhabditis elegans]